VRQQYPGSLRQVPGQHGLQRSRHRHPHQTRAGAVGGFGGQQRRARIIHRTGGDHGGAKRALVRVAAALGQNGLHVFGGDHSILHRDPGGHIRFQSDIDHVHLTQIVEGREAQHPHLGRGHAHRQVGAQGFRRHFSAVAVHAAGAVDCHHGEVILHLLYRCQHARHLGFERKLSAGAQHAIQHHAGAVEQIAQLLQVRVILR